MWRVDSSIVDGVEASDTVAPVRHRLLESQAPTKGTDVERLIGDYPSRWFTLASVWLAVAFSIGFGLFVNYQAQGREVSFVSSLMAVIPHYFFWVLVSPPIYRALHRTIGGTNRFLWIVSLIGWSLIALAGSTAMSFLSYFLRRGLIPDFERFVAIYILPPAGPAFWAMNFSILFMALTAFTAVRWRRLRDHALWNAARTELRRAKLEAQLAVTRLQVLQAQIHPHFVLNSLNAIAGLVQIGERDRAFDAIGRIGDLLQMALRNGTDINMTLGDEIEFLQRYLKLCELRFGSRFHYCISVPDALRSRRMPALIVQPLIENALRHGMQPSRALTVDVRAYERNGSIVIEVEDDGRGISPESAEVLRAGHGLANVAESLRLVFGDAACLRLEPLASRGTRPSTTCPS
jgi:signal transduction histidine kinase